MMADRATGRSQRWWYALGAVCAATAIVIAAASTCSDDSPFLEWTVLDAQTHALATLPMCTNGALRLTFSPGSAADHSAAHTVLRQWPMAWVRHVDACNDATAVSRATPERGPPLSALT